MSPETGGVGSSKNETAGPWSRLFARLFDLLIASILPLLAVKLLPSKAFFAGYGPLNPIWIVAGIILVPLETCLLAIWGMTPGKLLMGLRVQLISGQSIRWQEALNRSFSVFTLGLACMIPGVLLVAMFNSYRQLNESGSTTWDRRRFCVVRRYLSKMRILLFTVFFIAVLAFTGILER